MPARRGAGHRLQHLPDVEQLPRPVRLAGHRQRRRGQAAPAGGAAARDHRRGGADRARGQPASTRTWCSWRPRPTARAWRRRWPLRPEVAIIDYTGGPGFGGWLEREAAAAGKQVYTEKSGVNSIVLDSTDNLRACWATWRSRCRSTPARCARRRRTSTSARRHRDRRGPPVLRARSARSWPRRSPGSAPTTPRRSRSSARRSTTTCAPGPRRCPTWPRRPAARSSSTPAGSATRRYPDAVVRTPGLVAVDVAAGDGLHAGVLRPGDLPHRHGRHRPVAAGHARHDPRARRHDGGGLLDVRGRARRRPRRRRRLRCRALARTSPARCSSTRPRRSATSTAPAPTRRPTPPTSTRRSSPTGSAWSPPAATSDPLSLPSPDAPRCPNSDTGVRIRALRCVAGRGMATSVR